MHDSRDVGSSLSVVWHDNIVVILRAWAIVDEFEVECRRHIAGGDRIVGCDCIVLRVREWQDARTRKFGVCRLGHGFGMDSCHR